MFPYIKGNMVHQDTSTFSLSCIAPICEIFSYSHLSHTQSFGKQIYCFFPPWMRCYESKCSLCDRRGMFSFTKMCKLDDFLANQWPSFRLILVNWTSKIFKVYIHYGIMWNITGNNYCGKNCSSNKKATVRVLNVSNPSRA